MPVMKQPIANRVGEIRVTDRRVPGGQGNLAGDERRRAFRPVLDHFQQVAPLGIRERRQQPVINREQICLGETVQFPVGQTTR